MNSTERSKTAIYRALKVQSFSYSTANKKNIDIDLWLRSTELVRKSKEARKIRHNQFDNIIEDTINDRKFKGM
jgi:hypothetical protein